MLNLIPYLNLQKQMVVLPPIDPLREMLEKIKNTPMEYPPELLKARRQEFIRQIENKTGHVPAHPVGSKPISSTRKAA